MVLVNPNRYLAVDESSMGLDSSSAGLDTSSVCEPDSNPIGQNISCVSLDSRSVGPSSGQRVLEARQQVAKDENPAMRAQTVVL